LIFAWALQQCSANALSVIPMSRFYSTSNNSKMVQDTFTMADQ